MSTPGQLLDALNSSGVGWIGLQGEPPRASACVLHIGDQIAGVCAAGQRCCWGLS